MTNAEGAVHILESVADFSEELMVKQAVALFSRQRALVICGSGMKLA